MTSNQGSNSNDIIPSRNIFQYIIASGDMRFIERTERTIVLVGDWEGDWVIRGEVQGCGDACYADLPQILLEYVMSCEGCGDPSEVDLAIHVFCDRVADSIAELGQFGEAALEIPVQIENILDGILRSMPGTYTLTASSDGLRVEYPVCPICQYAKVGGIQRGRETGHEFFITLCERTLKSLSPEVRMSELAPWKESDHHLGFQISGI